MQRNRNDWTCLWPQNWVMRNETQNNSGKNMFVRQEPLYTNISIPNFSTVLIAYFSWILSKFQLVFDIFKWALVTHEGLISFMCHLGSLEYITINLTNISINLWCVRSISYHTLTQWCSVIIRAMNSLSNLNSFHS